jgi:hypothetical protein
MPDDDLVDDMDIAGLFSVIVHKRWGGAGLGAILSQPGTAERSGGQRRINGSWAARRACCTRRMHWRRW